MRTLKTGGPKVLFEAPAPVYEFSETFTLLYNDPDGLALPGSRKGAGMKLITHTITLLLVGVFVGSLAAVVVTWPFHNLAKGEQPIQRIWNSTTYPEADIERIIVRGLTLCRW